MTDTDTRPPPTTRAQPVITLDAALAVVALAVAEGARLGVAVSATVVDPSMALVAFAKADGATPHSVDSSRAKAATAASTRRPTGWMGADLAVALPLATGGRLTNIRGGEPIVVDGAVVGALGVAGGTPDQDAIVSATAVVRQADPDDGGTRS